MPLEIRELIIKATVNKDDGPSGGGTGEQASGESKINEVAERVFEILQEKSER